MNSGIITDDVPEVCISSSFIINKQQLSSLLIKSHLYLVLIMSFILISHICHFLFLFSQFSFIISSLKTLNSKFWFHYSKILLFLGNMSTGEKLRTVLTLIWEFWHLTSLRSLGTEKNKTFVFFQTCCALLPQVDELAYVGVLFMSGEQHLHVMFLDDRWGVVTGHVVRWTLYICFTFHLLPMIKLIMWS